MATERKRRTALLAILLALLAAGTLCVWGAAAAGFSFSSPALSAAIDAFNNARAGNGDVDTNGGGDVNISLPGGGGDGGDGDTGDGGDGDTGDGGNGGGSDAGGNDCFLGILCLDVDGDGIDLDIDGIGADLNADGEADGGNGLDIGGLHISATGDSNDSRTALAAAVTATGNEEGTCFLNLICLSANADASTNDITNANLDVNVHDEDEDLNLDVLGAGAVNSDPGDDSFLDSILSLFVHASAD
jgi:hypothetical protein